MVRTRGARRHAATRDTNRTVPDPAPARPWWDGHGLRRARSGARSHGGDQALPQRPGPADATERFTREARSAAGINHANIVTVHDFGEWQAQPYIVMQYVQGETLAEIVRRKAPMVVSDKLRLLEELCAGVSYAHEMGVIHRDIKPTNLMIDRSGRPKILDVGIARMLGTLASNATALIGTPGYMALRAAHLHRSISRRAVPAITHRIVNEEPVPLAQLLPDIIPDLVAVVERGLKKRATDRFADAESFRQAIVRVRRHLESGPDWMDSSAPTQEGSPFVGGRIQRGTGSARRPVAHAVGVAELTPPPDPRKTDREAIARRRAAQIEAALDLARRSLQQEELDEALDACQQALTLDDVHTVALELEQTIKLAIARRRAGELVADARDELAKGAITAAQSLLQQARALDPETPEAKRVERDLKLARIEQERLRQRGSLVIDAVPWATITAIQGLDGASQPLPSPASTPVVLRLPIGTYRIGVAGPPPASESRLLTVQVQEGVATSAPSERFETLTPEMYFEEYLTVSNPTAGAPDAPPAATPPSPPSPEKMP